MSETDSAAASVPAAVGGEVTAGAPAELAAGALPGRRRPRRSTPRAHPVHARFSDEEFAVLSVAAARAGVTPTSYVAQTAVGVARGVVAPLPSSTGDAVRELVAARTQLVRYGTLLNQSVAKLNATGTVDAGLGAALARCEAAVDGVRAATDQLTRGGRHAGGGR